AARGRQPNKPPPPPQPAPAAKPIDRSAQPPQQQQAERPTGSGLSAPAPQGSFFSRHPFLSGMMGGLVGAGLFGMLFGGGFGGGLAGGAGFLGLLLQVALIGGLVFIGMRLYRAWAANRGQSAAPAHAYGRGRAGNDRTTSRPAP